MSTAHEREGLRLNHAADLDWFFNDRRGDLGLHAQNYDPDRWRGDCHDPDRHGVARTAAVQREERVLAALRLLEKDRHDRVLSVAYSEHRWRGLERLGRAAGVAAWIYDPVDVADGGYALALLSNQKGAEAIFADYVQQAEKALREALAAYDAATRKVAQKREADKRRMAERDRKQAERMGVKWTAPVGDDQ